MVTTVAATMVADITWAAVTAAAAIWDIADIAPGTISAGAANTMDAISTAAAAITATTDAGSGTAAGTPMASARAGAGRRATTSSSGSAIKAPRFRPRHEV